MNLPDGPSPQVAAALVAALASVVTTIVTMISMWQLHLKSRRHDAAMEKWRNDMTTAVENWRVRAQEFHDNRAERQRIKDHMAKTRELLDRVQLSFRRLAERAPDLSTEAVLTETTDTLDLFAEYRRHVSGAEFMSYPEELKRSLHELQACLATIFLDLQIDDASRRDPDTGKRLAFSVRQLEDLRNQATNRIEAEVQTSLKAPELFSTT